MKDAKHKGHTDCKKEEGNIGGLTQKDWGLKMDAKQHQQNEVVNGCRKHG